MKFAPMLAAGALGVLMLALATAKAPNPPRKFVPIDFRGIETLEARNLPGTHVLVDTKPEPGLSYPDSTDSKARVRRDGSRLIVSGEFGYADLQLRVPPSVQRFVVEGVDIETKAPLDSVEVLSHGGVIWKGDVARLVLRDTSDPSPHAKDGDADADEDCSCSGHATLTVAGGRIGEVRAYSPHATLKLDDADAIGVVYAWLGPKGNISVETARRFDHLHLLPAGAPVPLAPAAATD